MFYKIDYKGIENIPRNQPVVIATNHANAFIDPCIVGILPIPKVRFFARGDVFKGKFVKWALESMNISPMYRMQEGYAEIKKNDKTFEECRVLLANDKALLLYPEAICILERRLRPLKKGLSRIVFQSAETINFSKNIWVVPAGINYSSASKFRSKVFIEFGKPLLVNDFKEKYFQDKVKTINEFTKVLEVKMQENLVIIKSTDNDKLVEVLEEMFLTEWLKRNKKDSKNIENQYVGAKQIAEMVNYIEENNPPLLLSLNQKALDYNRRMKANQLRDHLLHPDNIEKMNIGRFLLDFFALWFGVPFYLFGLLTNLPPYSVAKNKADEKVKHIEFYASVHANLGMIFWLLFYVFQLIAVGLIFKSWLFLGVYALAVPLSGIHALLFYPLFQKIKGRLRLLRMVRKYRSIVETLVADRHEIYQEIEEMIHCFNEKCVYPSKK